MRGRGRSRSGYAPRRQAASPLSKLGTALRVIVCCLFIAVIGIACTAVPAGIAPQDEQKLFDMPLLDGTQLMVSTPRSQWKQGELPYLFQTDPLWSEKPYAGGTVRANGCGPTCLTMVYIFLTGDTSIDPAQMCAFADAGNYAPTGSTEWIFMTRGASSLGITGRSIGASVSAVSAALEAGQPVICAVRPGDFTSIGHYIVLYGIDERGMVGVHDPNSSLRSAQAWRLDWVLAQTNAVWTYTA